MSKEKFIEMLAMLYSVMNRADSDNPEKEDWTHADMAGNAGCQQFDKIMNRLLDLGVISSDEFYAFYNNLN